MIKGVDDEDVMIIDIYNNEFIGVITEYKIKDGRGCFYILLEDDEVILPLKLKYIESIRKIL